jgi:superfamily I DNA/RNA helicase
MKIIKIQAGPGCGKTTYILNEVEKLLEKGVNPNKIAFLSFTNKAVDECKDRAFKKFNNYNDTDFIYFKTIHSFCNMFRNDNKTIIEEKHIKKFSEELNCPFSLGESAKIGNKILNIVERSRLNEVDPLEEFYNSNDSIDIRIFQMWMREYEAFKEQNKYVDFTDMLKSFEEELYIDYVFVDEAQDMCKLQWDVVFKIAKNCKELFIVGDINQSIYGFGGANPELLRKIKADEDVFLEKSYRLTKEVYGKAMDILSKNLFADKRNFGTRAEKGEVIDISSLRDVEFKKDETYYILFRNKYLTKDATDYLWSEGLYFSLFGESAIKKDFLRLKEIWGMDVNDWSLSDIKLVAKWSDYDIKPSNLAIYAQKRYEEVLTKIYMNDLEYMRQIERNNYNIFEKPHIDVTTIHQCKGGEADNVILFTDVSQKSWTSKETEEETRVWYVGATRAKKRLYIVQPKSNKYYGV